VIGAFWGTLVIALLTLIGVNEIVYGNFTTQTLPYLGAILFLLLAGYILYLMVFSMRLRIKKLLEIKRTETRNETSNG
jgi:protein-S-isoprenylcysteine O-methyltransferase Ste14